MNAMRLALALAVLATALPAPAQTLRMVDLGYMAGPGFVNYGTAVRLNDNDQVIGRGSNAGNATCFVWQRWAITDLGTMGGPRCDPRAINNAGQVAGTTTLPPTDPTQPYTAQERAFQWSATTGMRDLGAVYAEPPIQVGAEAMAMNEAGQVVGWGATSPGDWRGLFWATAGSAPQPVGPSQGYAFDVNAAGQVVGYAPGQAWFWENGQLSIIATLPSAMAFAINDAGQVIGSYSTIQSHGFVWRKGDAAITELRPLEPEGGSQPTAITADGRIVGTSRSADGRITRAALWQSVSADPVDLGVEMYPADVEVVNGVVNVLLNGGGGPHLCRGASPPACVALGTLGGDYAQAWDVNASGHVVGEASTASGEVHAVLWTTRTTPALLDDLVVLAKAFMLPGTYLSKLVNAQTLLKKGSTAKACTELSTFTTTVTAAAGAGVPASQAHQLTLGSRNVQRLLACP